MFQVNAVLYNTVVWNAAKLTIHFENCFIATTVEPFADVLQGTEGVGRSPLNNLKESMFQCPKTPANWSTLLTRQPFLSTTTYDAREAMIPQRLRQIILTLTVVSFFQSQIKATQFLKIIKTFFFYNFLIDDFCVKFCFNLPIVMHRARD